MPTNEELLMQLDQLTGGGTGPPEAQAVKSGLSGPVRTPSRIEDLTVEAGAKVAPGEVNAPWTRFSANLPTQDTTEEKMLTIMRNLGLSEEDVLAVPDPDDPNRKPHTILVRPKGSKNFIEFSSPDAHTFADYTEAAAGVVNPQTMLAVAFPAIAELRGVGVIGRTAAAALGGAAGRLGESTYGTLTGSELSTQTEQLHDALVTGGYAALGQGAGEALHGPSSFARGTLHGVPPGIADVVGETRAYNKGLPEEEQLIGPTPMDTVPISRRVAAQSAALVPKQGRFQISRLERVLSNITGMFNRIDPGKIPSSELERITNEWTKEISDAAASGLGSASTRNFLEAGRAGHRGISAFLEARTKLADDAYAEVRGLAHSQNVSFDIASAKGDVRAIANGILAPTEAGVAENPLNYYAPQPLLGDGTNALRATYSGETQQIMNIDQTLAGEFDRFIKLPDQLHNINVRPPGQPDVPSSAFETLKTIRTQVHGLILGGKLDEGNTRLAAQFLDHIQTTMENPIGGNKQFNMALRRANGIWRSTASVVDRLQLRAKLEDLKNNPEQAGRSLLNSDQPDHARMMRSIFAETEKYPDASNSNWQRVKDGYFSKLAENPSRIPAELDKWRNEPNMGGSRWLISDADEKGLRGWYNHDAAQATGPVRKAIEQSDMLGPQAFQAMLGSDARNLYTVQQLIKRGGGKDSSIGRAFRSGLIRTILEASTDLETTQQFTNPSNLRGIVTRLQNSGLLETVLTKDEANHLDFLVRLTSIFPRLSAGDSLVTAGAASQVTKIFNPMAIGGVVEKGLVLSRIAAIFNSKTARNWMAATVEGKDIGALRRIGWTRPLGVALSLATREHEPQAVKDYGKHAQPGPITRVINYGKSVSPVTVTIGKDKASP
jgi:hypothetical protein